MGLGEGYWDGQGKGKQQAHGTEGEWGKQAGCGSGTTGTHCQRQPQQPYSTLGKVLLLGELDLVLHGSEEAFQPHLGDAVSCEEEAAHGLNDTSSNNHFPWPEPRPHD